MRLIGTPNKILTAAHCVYQIKNDSNSDQVVTVELGCDKNLQEVCTKVLVTYHSEHDLFFNSGSDGTVDQNQSPLTFTADDIVIHPDYDKKSGIHDIAVVSLKQSVLDHSLLPQITVSCPQCSPNNLIMLGWGSLGSMINGSYYPLKLQKVFLPLIDTAECRQHYQKINSKWIITNQQLCAGRYLPLNQRNDPDLLETWNKSMARDACNGDSGGPLLAIDPLSPHIVYLVGIMSWGFDCGINPGVYT